MFIVLCSNWQWIDIQYPDAIQFCRELFLYNSSNDGICSGSHYSCGHDQFNWTLSAENCFEWLLRVCFFVVVAYILEFRLKWSIECKILRKILELRLMAFQRRNDVNRWISKYINNFSKKGRTFWDVQLFYKFTNVSFRWRFDEFLDLQSKKRWLTAHLENIHLENDANAAFDCFKISSAAFLEISSMWSIKLPQDLTCYSCGCNHTRLKSDYQAIRNDLRVEITNESLQAATTWVGKPLKTGL